MNADRRQLPHSPDDEARLISCCLLDGNDVLSRCLEARLQPESFYLRAHGIVFGRLLKMRERDLPIDVAVLAAELQSANELDEIGGHPFLAQVSSAITTTAQAGYFIERVRQQNLLREIIRAGSEAVESCYGFSGDIDELAANVQSRLQKAVVAAQPRQRVAIKPLLSIPSPTAGTRSDVNLLGNGLLRRGQGGMFNGPTGVGKSVVLGQAAQCWGCGRDLFGIRPQQPLRSLIVQSENDDDDVAETRDGILAGMHFTAAEVEAIGNNVATIRSFSSGASWLSEIKPAVELFKPDLLIVDPLFAFAGVDVAKDQPGVSAFLRELVQPFIIKHGCGIIFVHHTNKPPSGKDKPQWQGGDFAYTGSGHNELANWPRFVIALRSLGSRTVFEMRIGKRWKRAGIADANGVPLDRVLIKHSDTGICWLPASDADLAESVESAASGRPSRLPTDDTIQKIVTAFHALQRNGRADLDSVARRVKVSVKTVRRRFDARGILRAGDDVLVIANSTISALVEEAQDELV